ncbi:hypothetical protein [Caulobacter sp. SSI4214]|uniref:hypothetical protein n=1 Tax=Caulobacter sp. SSI4214 TaxID=2575739 RepID=UPI00143B1A2E|nr:hypothetical protein [Caulobacter sp. SSI4214]
MASSDDGYATPAAAVIAMAIAVVTIAYVSRSTTELRLARADFKKTQAQYLLAGAHNVALLAIATSSKPPPYRWTVPALGKAFQVVAEPERPKLSLQAAADLDDAVLDRLGVKDHEATRARLANPPSVEGLPWAADAATSTGWRACADALISFYGAAAAPPVLSYVEPEAGKDDSKWRAGEVWRIAVTDEDGWRDERIVRFTGNGLNPAAVISRRLSRGWKDNLACETLLADAG